MPDDKNQDSDRQMLIKISRNFAVLFIIIQMYDSLFDWTLGFLDLALEGLHIIIEAFEYGIEVILEHTLHTNHQQSEIIIVNAAIILGLYFSYKLIRALPRIHNRITNSILRSINRKSSSWISMPLPRKIKWISAYSIGTYFLLFLITL